MQKQLGAAMRIFALVLVAVFAAESPAGDKGNKIGNFDDQSIQKFLKLQKRPLSDYSGQLRNMNQVFGEVTAKLASRQQPDRVVPKLRNNRRLKLRFSSRPKSPYQIPVVIGNYQTVDVADPDRDHQNQYLPHRTEFDPPICEHVHPHHFGEPRHCPLIPPPTSGRIR